MKVIQYLRQKYGVDKPTTMTRTEATEFGIPYPLNKDWLLMYGDRDIPQYKLESLAVKMERRARKQERKGKSTKYSLRAKAICEGGIQSNRQKKTYAAKDEFLSSYEWRKLRMVALKKYGAICQCCGASPKDGAVINVDHIKPRKLFPELALDINNLQVLCSACNHGKGNWDHTDWRKQ